MAADFNPNQIVAGVRIASDIEVKPWNTTYKQNTFMAFFNVVICDIGAAVLPCIAYGDYAHKLAAKLKKGDRVVLWANVQMFHGELKFNVQKCILEAYAEPETIDG